MHTDTIKNAKYLATLSWLPETTSAIPSTKLIQFFSAGTNHISNHPIYTDSKIPLCSANGVHGPQIAEWVIMMDLVHSHSYTKLYDNQKKKVWDQKAGMNVSDRVGKRVGVLGYGSIGRQGMSNTFFLVVCGLDFAPNAQRRDQYLMAIRCRGAPGFCTRTGGDLSCHAPSKVANTSQSHT
jgi:phosphoglycerate dehydrogenase-like enzyme